MLDTLYCRGHWHKVAQSQLPIISVTPAKSPHHSYQKTSTMQVLLAANNSLTGEPTPKSYHVHDLYSISQIPAPCYRYIIKYTCTSTYTYLLPASNSHNCQLIIVREQVPPCLLPTPSLPPSAMPPSEPLPSCPAPLCPTPLRPAPRLSNPSNLSHTGQLPHSLTLCLVCTSPTLP